jgi:hypothetical protein
MNQPNSETIESLVLVRLLALPQKNRPAAGKIRDELYIVVQDALSASDWKSAFDAAMEQLLADRLVVKPPLALTDAGRARALQFLGVSSLPANIRWPQLRDVYLVAKAMGLSPESAEVRQAVKQPERLRGLVVKQEHNLPTGALPTLTQATDALAWRKLGVETDEPFNQKNVTRFLLGQDLKQRTRLSTSQLRNQLPAKALDLARGDTRALRSSLLRKWAATNLCSASPDASAVLTQPVTTPTETDQPRPQPLELDDFARQVMNAAMSLENGHFGDRKVFINHVWKKLKDAPVCQSLDLRQFKHHLTEANNRGLLSLTRADLVGAMDSQDVQESETRYLDDVFHFVQI